MGHVVDVLVRADRRRPGVLADAARDVPLELPAPDRGRRQFQVIKYVSSCPRLAVSTRPRTRSGTLCLLSGTRTTETQTSPVYCLPGREGRGTPGRTGTGRTGTPPVRRHTPRVEGRTSHRWILSEGQRARRRAPNHHELGGSHTVDGDTHYLNSKGTPQKTPHAPWSSRTTSPGSGQEAIPWKSETTRGKNGAVRAIHRGICIGSKSLLVGTQGRRCPTHPTGSWGAREQDVLTLRVRSAQTDRILPSRRRRHRQTRKDTKTAEKSWRLRRHMYKSYFATGGP